MRCPVCHGKVADGSRFCTNCGADLQGRVYREGDGSGRGLKALAIVLSVVAVLAVVVVGGVVTDWYGIPGALGLGDARSEDVDRTTVTNASEGQASEDVLADNDSTDESAVTDSGVPVRDALDAYSWDELSQISAKISATVDDSQAVETAAHYNLCGPDGELSGMGSKSITLDSGVTLHARIIGFNHDTRSDGGRAGITFLFDEAVALQPWKQSGYNDGGWQGSSVRSWLSMTFLSALPDALSRVIVAVDKQTNNTGGVDDGTLPTSVVTATSDKLWLPSHVELAGSDSKDAHWSEDKFGTQYLWCNDIAASEGSQYALFSQLAADGHAANPQLVRSYEGTPVKWWMRTPNPHISFDTLRVSEDGTLDGDTGSVESLGVVPGFCV